MTSRLSMRKSLDETRRQDTDATVDQHGSSSNANVFSDAHAIEPVMLTESPSDEFGSGAIPFDIDFNDSNLDLRLSATNPTPSEYPPATLARTRSSIAKVPPPSAAKRRNSRGFGAGGSRNSYTATSGSPARQRNRSPETPADNRRDSVSTVNTNRFSMVRPQSPYRGPTGPSQPYAMYSQGVNRMSSTTTTSTVRPTPQPQPPVEQHSPQQPYAMYQQNTVEEDIESSSIDIGTMNIPQGFPTPDPHNQHYQRRYQNGEETGEIVGPDGHTEQLPPYTRYPDDIPPKNPQGPGVGVAGAAGAAGGLVAGAAIVGAASSSSAGGLASTNVSTDHLSSPRVSAGALSPGSHRSFDSMATGSAAALNHVSSSNSLNNVPYNEKEENWKEKMKRPLFWGVPLWAVLVLVFVLTAALIGGIVGGVLGSRKPPPHHKPSSSSAVTTVTATTYLDATPFATALTGLPALQTGDFTFTTDQPKSESQTCVVDSSYSNAWGCMPGGSLGFNMASDDNGYYLTFQPNPLESNFTYGPQPPNINGVHPLETMSDRDSPSLGPAAFLYVEYDKLVILRDTDISASAKKQRSISERDFGEGPPPGFMRHQMAQNGDKPWFCYWNSTILETFIYYEEIRNITTTSAYQPPTGTSTGTSSPPTSVAATTTSTSAAMTSTAAAKAKRFNYDPGDTSHSYPNVMKLEEKRSAQNTVSPYCQQMTLGGDGKLTQLPTPTITIQETEPAAKKKRSYGHANRFIQRQIGSDCNCEWLMD